MTLTQRRILYSFFFLIFFISAPLVILWAEGYKYNFKKHAFQKTGVIFIESKPSNAKIFLNNKKTDEKTTARLKNLLPGTYEIRLEKEGYQTWQKKVTVEESKTVFLQYVRLFKNFETPIEKISASILSHEKSGEKIIMLEEKLNKKELTVLSLNDYSKICSLPINNEPQLISISPQAEFAYLNFEANNPPLLINTTDIILNLNSCESYDLRNVVGSFNVLRWSKHSRNGVAFLLNKNKVSKFNLFSKESVDVLTKNNILDFEQLNNSFYYLINDGEKIIFEKEMLGGTQKATKIKEMPLAENIEFVGNYNDYFFIHDKTNNVFYQVNANEKSEEKMKIIAEVKKVESTNKQNEFLLMNDFEIYNYNVEKKQETLIVRVAEKIKAAHYYTLPTHILYLTEKELRVIENTTGQNVMQNYSLKKNILDFAIKNTEEVVLIGEDGVHEVQIQ